MATTMNDKLLTTIGENVIKAQERKQKYNEEHQAEWEAFGETLKKGREELQIQRSQMAEAMGCSPIVVDRLEAGLPVRRRRMVERAYLSAIETIHMERRIIFQDLMDSLSDFGEQKISLDNSCEKN